MDSWARGSQSTSDAFQNEPRFQGAESSPSFVRTLKEPLRWGRTFSTVEELRRALLAWALRYNEHRLLERQARRELIQVKQAA